MNSLALFALCLESEWGPNLFFEHSCSNSIIPVCNNLRGWSSPLPIFLPVEDKTHPKSWCFLAFQRNFVCRYVFHSTNVTWSLHPFIRILFFPAKVEYFYFSYFRLKIFLWVFFDISVFECIWCLDVIKKLGASLQAFKPDMTHKITCRDIISIEDTSCDVLSLFGWVCRLEKGIVL